MHKPDYPALTRAIRALEVIRRVVHRLDGLIPSERPTEFDLREALRQGRTNLDAFERSLTHGTQEMYR